jgi:hypothetical protein
MTIDVAMWPEIERLEAEIRSRLGGRVRALRLVVRNDGFVLQGHSRTHHAKQVAQHAAVEGTTLPLLANEIEVSAERSEDTIGS